MTRIPKRWEEYKPTGSVIPGTRFIPFKCPLTENKFDNSAIAQDMVLTPKLLLESIPNLGIIIDLTNTRRYYHPDLFLKHGIKHGKVAVAGHVVPTLRNRKEFTKLVNNFLADNQDNDKVIGVHCTHGVNRTGFMICEYLVAQCKWSAYDAIAKFASARGYGIERQNYTDFIKNQNNINKKNQQLLSQNNQFEAKLHKFKDSIAVDSDTVKGTQTEKGFWISSQDVVHQNYSRHTNSKSMDGMIHVNESNLISDGKGGYFVHIKSQKQIIRNNNWRQSKNNEACRGQKKKFEPYRDVNDGHCSNDFRYVSTDNREYPIKSNRFIDRELNVISNCSENVRESYFKRFKWNISKESQGNQSNEEEEESIQSSTNDQTNISPLE